MKEKTKIERLEKSIKFRNRDGKRATITINGYVFYYYYNSLIVAVNLKTNKHYIGKDAFYSCTTGKFRNIILLETKAQTKAKLKSGEYIQLDV